jgi:hypothetical protein
MTQEMYYFILFPIAITGTKIVSDPYVPGNAVNIVIAEGLQFPTKFRFIFNPQRAAEWHHGNIREYQTILPVQTFARLFPTVSANWLDLLSLFAILIHALLFFFLLFHRRLSFLNQNWLLITGRGTPEVLRNEMEQNSGKTMLNLATAVVRCAARFGSSFLLFSEAVFHLLCVL